MVDETTTISISKKTREELGKLGTVDDDMDSIIQKLLKSYNKRKVHKDGALER